MKSLFAGLLICIASQSLAQAIELSQAPFHEVITENSKVSGDVVMGVMLSDDVASNSAPAVVTGVPERWRRPDGPTDVCVKTVSKDGRYEAANTYRVPAGFDGARAPFDYLGKRGDFLAERKVAVLVSEGACGNRAELVLPAVWKAGQGGGALNVFINAAGNHTAVAVEKGTEFFEPCEDVTESEGLKYTARCVIPRAMLKQDAPTQLTVFISRSGTEEYFSLKVAPVFGDG